MYAGFDIGGTHARACLFDDQWQVLQTKKVRSRADLSPEGVAGVMVALLDELLEAQGASRGQVQCVGVGFAGQLDVTGTIVRNAPNFGWREVPFAALLQQRWGSALPVRLVNDLNALLWGEAVGGAVMGAQDVLAVYVGTGIGGAIISQGQLIEGASGVAAELGHMKVVVEGNACGCGERGCVEAYAGGVHLERAVARLANDSRYSGLSALIKEDALGADLKRADALSAEHEALDALWQEATGHLALIVANSCTLLNPSKLLLGGGVLEHCERFKALFLTKMAPLVLRVASEPLTLAWASLDHAGMLGAAHLASKPSASSP